MARQDYLNMTISQPSGISLKLFLKIIEILKRKMSQALVGLDIFMTQNPYSQIQVQVYFQEINNKFYSGKNINNTYIQVVKSITMYTGPLCNFCDAAKRLLLRNNLEFNEIDISTKSGLMDEMIKKANGKRTIPQIFFDDHHVGGYQELRTLEKSGELKKLIK